MRTTFFEEPRAPPMYGGPQVSKSFFSRLVNFKAPSNQYILQGKSPPSCHAFRCDAFRYDSIRHDSKGSTCFLHIRSM